MRRLALVGAGALALVVAAPSCREPTQITLVLSTDVPCSTVAKTQTEIAIGTRVEVSAGSGQNVGTAQCDAGNIGSLAVVPSENGDTVAIAAYLSTREAKRSESCRTDPTDCIVAQRVISFVEHTPLTLPVALSSKCLNVRCGVEQTCVDGACVSDRVDTTQCKGGVCGTNTLPPVDGGVADASAPDAEAGVDSGCGNLQTDPKNCGACGFDCGAGECVAGACRLIPAAKVPDAPTELGCLAMAPSTGEVFWTRTKAPTPGVYRLKTTGGTALAPFLTGPVGAGISSNASVVAFTTAGGSSATLFECDPTMSASLCKQRSVVTASGAAAFMATKPNANESWALFPTIIASTVPADDFPTSNAISGLAASPKRVGFYRNPLSGGAVTVFSPGNGSSQFSVQPPGATGFVADALADSIFVGDGLAIDRIDGTNLLVGYIGGLPTAPQQLALDPAPGTFLYWSAVEGNTSALFRTPSGGGKPVERMYATPIAVQCLVATADALYWLSAGVPYKGHK